jgi:serine/threonine protein kinase/tetratricopeptide (TPR) repeat protein
MSPEQCDKVKELYQASQGCDVVRRAALLRESSADEVVLQEVHRLLTERDELTSFPTVPPAAGKRVAANGVKGRFEAGQVLAQRFRITRFIAAGGMGEVYEADDLELKEALALKTIRPEVLQHDNVLARFKREVHLARKVTHPNICRVFDLFWHKTTDHSGESDIVFVTMELLRGETLAERIKRVGPISTKEALPLIRQIASGLEAAHHAGVVHRDFKPGNVILVPDGNTGDTRSVITDFGLAFRTGVDTSMSVDLTAAHGVVGTPAYMAPEQFEGREVTKLADIYALGLVIHEMVTGVRGFPAHISAGSKAIPADSGETQATRATDLSNAWEYAIVRCLERNPASRYASALDVVKALADEQAVSPLSLRHRWNFAAAGLLIILLFGLYIGLNFGWTRGRSSENASPEAGAPIPLHIKSRRSVAVLGLKNVSGRSDKAWFSTAIPGMLTTELAAGEQLRTVAGEDVSQMTTSLSLPASDGYGKETLQKIYKNLNADVVVVGSYLAIGDGQVRLDLRLQNAQQGETLASVSERGREDQIDELVTKAGAELRSKLGVEAISLAQAAEVRATFPTSTEAARLYAEGVSKLRKFDCVAARDLFLKAVSEDPKFALAHSALSSAYSALGNDEKARLSARNAFDLSAGLSREDRLFVEARYREANQEWDNAAKSYGALFNYFSDNLEYGILLAGTQIRGGNAKQALKTLETLRQLPAPSREDPRIDLKEAETHLELGEFDKAEARAADAVRNARANGATLIMADSLFRQAQASESLNRTKEAMTFIQEAAKIYGAAGNRNGEARSLEVMANVFADTSDFPDALASYKKELATAREIGNRHLEASALNNMALVLKGEGDREGARKMFEEALLSFRDLNDKASSAQALLNIAGFALEEGDLVAAKKIYEQALSTSREINDQNGIAMATAAVGTVLDAQGNLAEAKKLLVQAIDIDLSGGLKHAPADKLVSLGDVLRQQGNFIEATKSYQDALTGARESGDKSNTALAQTGLGEIQLETATFDEARKNYEEALAASTEAGDKTALAATQIALAELAIQEGRPSDAVAPAKSAIEQFRRVRLRDPELAAGAVLSRALLSQAKIPEARQELNVHAALVARSQNPASKIAFEIATARVEAASGKAAGAGILLKTALANATRFGLVREQLECRLAAEEVLPGAQKSPESQARLSQLARDAREKGFILIARKATEMPAH